MRKRKIIACTSHCGLFLIDIESDEFAVVSRDGNGKKLKYWGMSWSDDRFFVGFGGLGESWVRVYDTKFNELKPIYPQKDFIKVGEPHQFLWHDNKLWVCNTHYDRIAIMDGNEWYDWVPTGLKPVDRLRLKGKDYYHINCIWSHGKHLYFNLHNRERPSQVRIYSYPGLHLADVYNYVGFNTHNIWKEPNGKNLLVCSSFEGRIREITNRLRPGTVVCVPQLRYDRVFPRGVVSTDDLIVIGLPVWRRTRHTRGRVASSIFLYDKKWALRKRYKIKGFGSLYEMRGLNVPDYAHYRGSEKIEFVPNVNWQKMEAKNGWGVVRGK